MSWLHADAPDSSATHPILGASMVCRSVQGSAVSGIRPQQSLLRIPTSPPHTQALLPNSPEFPLHASVPLPWSQQVAVMFQIVCALALDVPEVLRELEQLRGIPPNVQLSCEPCRLVH